MHAPAHSALYLTPVLIGGIVLPGWVALRVWVRAGQEAVGSGDQYPYLQGGIPTYVPESWHVIPYVR